MKRRYALKQIMLATGVVGLFPACYKSLNQSSIKLKNLNISTDDEKTLAEIVDTIIPKTDTPGAKELSVDLFVLKMVDDCYPPEEQKAFVNGLQQLPSLAKKLTGQSFDKSGTSERQNILKRLSESDAESDLAKFYKMVRHRTIQGYMNSEHVMSKLVIYEMVPGRYNGYFPVATT